MSTYTQIIYQLVFGTKRRRNTLTKEGRPQLYKYFNGIFTERKCHVYRVNEVANHTHFVFSLHPTIALSDLVKSLKHGSTYLIKNEKLFPDFIGWQAGYSAFTYSIEAKENLIRYVINQEKHHAVESFLDEYLRLLREGQVEINPKYPYSHLRVCSKCITESKKSNLKNPFLCYRNV